jgi:hypothetical protein
VRHPLRALRAVRGRHPLTILALDAPDGDRRAHALCRYRARHALILRRPLALLHGGHQAVRRVRAPGIPPLGERVGLERLTEPRQERPLPLAAQECRGQGRARLPALSLGLIPSTGGAPRQRRMRRPMAPMGGEHGAGAPPERLAPDRARERIPALRPPAPERVEYHRGVGVQGRPAQRRPRQENGPLAPPLVQDPAHLPAPGVHRDWGAPPAQRRLTAQRHQVRALAPGPAALCARAQLRRVATREPLGHPAMVIGWLLTRLGALQRRPMLGTDRLAGTPVPSGLGHPWVAPHAGENLCAVQRLYHTAPAPSTPSAACIRAAAALHSP